MTEITILLLEDDELQRKSIFDTLSAWGHNVLACDSLSDARKRLAKTSFDMALVDIRLPDGSGLDFVEKQVVERPNMSMVVMTAFSDVDTAVASIKLGAYDYLPKPFKNEQLEKIVRNISDKTVLSQRVADLSRLTTGGYDDVWQLDSMIGSAALRPVFEKAQRVARVPNATILILGETGTGKGMLAKAIHRLSPRADKPFVDINCSAIPGQLIESELFGHEKGAFTDAKIAKPGLVEVAEGGTMFLDEIGDMESNLQAKILKIIEDKSFRRLGSGRETKSDVRTIAATNRDLKAMIEDGTFREDLYYRLSVISIVLPPLREHPESIRPLAERYLQSYCKEINGPTKRLTPAAFDAMMAYPWPGNVRELRHAVERGAIFANDGMITPADLQLEHVGPAAAETGRDDIVSPAGPPAATEAGPVSGSGSDDREPEVPPMSLAECEKLLISSVLTSTNGNKNKAAEVLDIHRTTLYKKIEQYGLDASS